MINKLLKYGFGLLSIAVIIASCEKGPDYKEYTYPAQTVTGLTPTSGYPGIDVTITGKDFGIYKNAVKIWFGGVMADTIRSCTDNQIVVRVPDKAITGKVSLQVWTTKLDSIGTFTVYPAPVIYSIASNNPQTNIAFPGDTLTIKGIRFGTDASKITVNFNGGAGAVIAPITDTAIKVKAPASFASGYVTLTISGLTLIANPVIVNPNAPGNITPYFLANTGDTTKGGSFTYTGSLVSNRWGTLAAPWVTNAAAKNKSGVGGYSKDVPSGAVAGTLCWETWANTPIVDGIVYQPTIMALPAGNYTFSFNYYAEVQTNCTVYGVVAAGGSGIPVLANLGTALGSVQCYNGTAIGSTTPNITETKSVTFTLASSQVVSIGFLGNLAGATTQGAYFRVSWIKLVKN